MNRIESASALVDRAVRHLLFVFGFSMALVVALQVLFRYGLNQSLFWSEELARFFLVWLTFLGATVAYRRGMHPGVDVLTVRMSGRLRRGCAVFVHLVCMGFFAVMVVYGALFAHFIRMQISPALNLPKWIVMSVIPVSGGICLLHGMALTIKELSEPAGDR